MDGKYEEYILRKFEINNKIGINTKDLITTLAIILFSLLIISIGYFVFKTYSTTNDGVMVEKGKVLSIENVDETTNWHTVDYSTKTTTITFTAKVKGGELKGDIVEAIQIQNTMYAMHDMTVEEGDIVLLTEMKNPNTGETSWAFVGYHRLGKLALITIIFLLFLVIIGRRQGVTTIISLVLICLAVFLVYIPSILAGVNIYLSTTILGIYIVLMSLIIIGGVNKKTLCAILGNIGGVLIAAIIAYYMNDVLKMTGFIDDTYANLKVANTKESLDLVALVWAGIVLGSMGAVMDVAMSIASSMNELGEHMRNKTFFKLVKSGLNIGKDITGTMSNTLILAYMGSSLALVILFMINTKDLNFLFSLEVIAEQIIQSVVGSMGILFAVPFTAIFSAWVFNAEK